jgi:hypothetical protein
MRYFLCVSLLCLLSSCRVREYQKAVKAPEVVQNTFSDQSTSYQPVFDKVLYNCVVDGKTPLGKRYHLSGLLFIKQLEEGKRVVFQNQMGITYFDFGWDNNGNFSVHNIMSQMDKAPLIKTLKKDFELLLFYNLPQKSSGVYALPKYPEDHYLKFDLSKGFVYYIFDQQQLLNRIENADDRKKVTIMKTSPTKTGNLPETIQINHLKANFTIQLQQLNTNNLQTTEDVITE